MSSPVVIALVSGKGGVGKTMLSVGVAKELALSNRTLIVDLDFFNRGLTGLMSDCATTCEIDKPDFLSTDQSATNITWRIVQVTKNLFHIAYPDLLPEEMQKFETLDVNVLRNSLRAFVLEACERCQCDVVVLDCHGGPDNSSFAACLFADYSLLISEPDRITFYGTLNFLRQLKRVAGDEHVDIRLVFNKVVPAFSGLFLRSLYNRLIREQFGGRPLLAVFPLEIYLTKEFEKTPFLTAVYPGSWLAKKTRTLLYDLLAPERRERLPAAISSLPRWMRAYTKLVLGRQFPVLNMNVVMSAIVITVVVFTLITMSVSQFYAGERERIKQSALIVQTLQCLDPNGDLRNDTQLIDSIISSNSISAYAVRNKLSEAERFVIKDFEKRLKEREALVNCIFQGEDYPEDLQMRSSALNNLRPLNVPDKYKSVYETNLSALRNTGRLYRTLKRAEDIAGDLVGFLYAIAAGWLALVLLINWSTLLERRFTYYCRLRRLLSAAGFYLIAIALWFWPLVLVLFLVENSLSPPSQGPAKWVLRVGTTLVTAVLAMLTLEQLIRSYRDSRYEGHSVESTLRAGFALYLALGPIAIYLIFKR